MPELPSILIAGLTGFTSGLLLSIPVGPVNLTIMNEGARRGLRQALMIGVGASIMEVIYCALAFTGFAGFFQGKYVKAAMELFSFVFLVVLGLKFLCAKTLQTPGRVEERIEGRLRPESAFMMGFVRVMANPGVLLVWIILAANFISRDLVRPEAASKVACITGVLMGTTLWFFGLAWAVSRGHRKFSEKTLLRMEHGSGIGLLVLGLLHGIQIVWQLAERKL